MSSWWTARKFVDGMRNRVSAHNAGLRRVIFLLCKRCSKAGRLVYRRSLLFNLLHLLPSQLWSLGSYSMDRYKPTSLCRRERPFNGTPQPLEQLCHVSRVFPLVEQLAGIRDLLRG